MVDSVQVWPPGYRISNTNGDPVSGATIEFYDAGTTDAKTVYSDSGLSTSLGTTVYCDSEGAPVASSGSSTRVTVYVNDEAYKVVIKDSSGSTIETKDNLKGALDTATFEAGTTAIPTAAVIFPGGNYTIATSVRGKVVAMNPTGGSVTATLPSAVTAGDGWLVTIQHIGSANKVNIATVSSQTITVPIAGGATTGFELVSFGETITLTSDGANWRVISHVDGLKLGSGYHAEPHDNGTITSGTLTCDPEEGNIQRVTNGGAFTLGVPSETTSIRLKVTNNASAGAITTSGFDKVIGSFTTGNGDKFFAVIDVDGSDSMLTVTALQ